MTQKTVDAEDLAVTGVYGVLIAVVVGWLDVTLPHFPNVALSTAIDLGAVSMTPAWVVGTALLGYIAFTNDFTPSSLTNKWLALFGGGAVFHLAVGLIPSIASGVQASPLLGGIVGILMLANAYIIGYLG
jgi:hypothetical protein